MSLTFPDDKQAGRDAVTKATATVHVLTLARISNTAPEPMSRPKEAKRTIAKVCKPITYGDVI